jgi:hypothetical protein
MLTKMLELCRTGSHGQAGTVVTKQDLDEIVETYKAKSASVTIWPHALADYAPALGTVDTLWTGPSDEDPSAWSLFGTITFNDLLSDAYEKGMYPTWSIGAPRRASDGKRYLHHLKMCGSEPGAVKGLKDLGLPAGINLSDCPPGDQFPGPKNENPYKVQSINASDPAKPGGDRGQPGVAGKKKDKEESMDPLQELIDAIEDPEKKAQAQTAYDALKAKAKPPAKPAAPAENPIAASDTTALAEENTKLKAQLKGLAAKYPAEKIELSDLADDPRIAALYADLRKSKRNELLKAAEGKVPKGMEKELIALADTLPISDTIALDDSGEKQSAFDIFSRILQNLPDPVTGGEVIEMSDAGGKGKKSSRAFPFSKA